MLNSFRSFLLKTPVTEKPSLVATDNSLTLEVDKDIDIAARSYIQKSNTVGLAIGIVKNREVFTYGYGETARGNKIIPTAESIFEIGSITKTFTATILAYFVNAGKISLADPITQYLPEDVAANPQLQNIRIVDLSNHTSGLPRLPGNLFFLNFSLRNPYKNYTRAKLFAALKKCKVGSVPGEVYAYSNFGVGLLGVILERVSGRSYEELVRDIITAPLGMESTMQHLNSTAAGRLVSVYNAKDHETKHWNFDSLAACGALRSTIADLLIYAQANIKTTDQTLSTAFELTQQITFSKTPKTGLGWHLLTLNNVNYYWHNGGTGGSRSFLLFSAEKNIAIAVLSNAAVGCDELAINILKKIQ